MVLPIVIGIGVTVGALVAKSGIAAYTRYARLTPQTIAALNNIRLNYGVGQRDEDEFHQFLREKYPVGGFGAKMTEQEALLVLGIEGDDITKLDRKLLKERYRKLMVMNHPDKKGSQYLSQKINQAKDILEKSYLLKK